MAPIAESVPVDVNPGGTEPVDWRTQSTLTAAILSDLNFDAADVDVSTLLYGDPLLIADGATPVSPISSVLMDVNGDGMLDLALEFDLDQMRANGVVDLSTEENYFAGQLNDDTDIAGRDAVTFIPEPSGLLMAVGVVLLLAGARRR